jgi:hypothetical protein
MVGEFMPHGLVRLAVGDLPEGGVVHPGQHPRLYHDGSMNSMK